MIIMHWQSQNKKRRFSKLWTKQTKQNQDHDIAHCMDDEKTNESVLQVERSNGNIHYPRMCEYGIRWDVDGGRGGRMEVRARGGDYDYVSIYECRWV